MTIDSRKLIAQINVTFNKELLEKLAEKIAEYQDEKGKDHYSNSSYPFNCADIESFELGAEQGVYDACDSILSAVFALIQSIGKEEGHKRPDWEL